MEKKTIVGSSNWKAKLAGTAKIENKI